MAWTWIPRHLIKRWITYKGRRIPIVDWKAAEHYITRTLGSLGVEGVGVVSKNELDFLRASRRGYLVRDLRPIKNVPIMKLLRVTDVLQKCEKLFPGITRGLKLRFYSCSEYGLHGAYVPVLNKEFWERFSVDMTEFAKMEGSPLAFVKARVKRLTHWIFRKIKLHEAVLKAYSVDAETIFLNVRKRSSSFSDGLDWCVAHEVGHRLYHAIPKEIHRRWLKVFFQYHKGLRSRSRVHLTLYSASSPEEGFAEAFTCYVNYNDVLRVFWPEAREFFDWLRKHYWLGGR